MPGEFVFLYNGSFLLADETEITLNELHFLYESYKNVFFLLSLL